MKTISARYRQSLCDIAIEHCGNFEAAIDIARANHLSLTERLAEGQSLLVPEASPTHARVVRHLQRQGISPATDFDRPPRNVFSPEFSPEFL